jgi:hypothetical protein
MAQPLPTEPFGASSDATRSLESSASGWSGASALPAIQCCAVILFEAASTLISRTKRWRALKPWRVRSITRAGRQRAMIAVARKIAAILHGMWHDGMVFRWSAPKSATA